MTAAGRQATRQRFDAPLAELIAEAAVLRDSAHGRLISYSRKVFIPLTKLCRDVCHYCTFADVPRAGSPSTSHPLMNESISRAAGTPHGQEFPPHEMEAHIRSIGREPMQRDTLYRPVPEDRRAASMIAADLEPIVLTPPRKKAAVGQAMPRSASSAGTPSSSSSVRVRVPADCSRRRKSAKSTGWSISIAIPG